MLETIVPKKRGRGVKEGGWIKRNGRGKGDPAWWIRGLLPDKYRRQHDKISALSLSALGPRPNTIWIPDLTNQTLASIQMYNIFGCSTNNKSFWFQVHFEEDSRRNLHEQRTSTTGTDSLQNVEVRPLGWDSPSTKLCYLSPWQVLLQWKKIQKGKLW